MSQTSCLVCDIVKNFDKITWHKVYFCTYLYILGGVVSFCLVLAQQKRGLDQHILPKLHEQAFGFVTSSLTLMNFLQGTAIFISKYYVKEWYILPDRFAFKEMFLNMCLNFVYKLSRRRRKLERMCVCVFLVLHRVSHNLKCNFEHWEMHWLRCQSPGYFLPIAFCIYCT